MQELQCEGLHLVVEEIVAEHKSGFLLHYLVHNHGRLLGMIVGIAADTQHDVGHDHRGQTPRDIEMRTIVQQRTLASHNELDLGLQEYGKDADDEAGSHVGYTLWSKLPVGEHAQCEDLVVQLEQIR